MELEILSEHPAGPPSGHPLLFVHGAWHGAWCWEHLLPWFAARGFAAYAVSLRGHGGSDGRRQLRRWSVRHYVADLGEAVASIDGDPILVGHSMGGLIVQRHLEKHSAPGAVLLASVPVTGALATTLRVARHHPVVFLKANLQLRLGPIVGSEALVRDLLFSPDSPAAIVDETFHRLQDESYLAYLSMILRRPRPDRVVSPVLVIGAEGDRIFHPHEVVATATAYRTDAVMLGGRGHDLMLEPGWEEVAETIRRWVETIEGAGL